MKYFFSFILLIFSGTALAEGLINIEVLSGKVSILVPKNFGPMQKDILKLKYPSSRKPTEVLSNTAGSVTLAFNHTNDLMHPIQVRQSHATISKMFHNLYPSATWIRDEVVEQNGSTFMVLELITPAMDTQIHNIIYGTSVDGRFLLAAFNTTIEESKVWLPIGKEIMSSLSIQ